MEYYFKIQYTKGIENARVDTLSRKAKLQNNKKLLEVSQISRDAYRILF